MRGNRKRTDGPTLKSVGDSVGLSQSTVSKALRGAADISPETAAIAIAAAERMGFDAVHLSGKVNCRKSVGVVFMELCSEYYNGIYQSFNRIMEEKGYRVVTLLTDFNDIQKQEDSVQYLARFRVSGILFLTELEFDLSKIKHTVTKYGIPTVIISRMTRVDFADVISVNHSIGVENSIEHLAGLGHKNIAFIGDEYTGRRERSFRDTLPRLGLPVNEKAIITDCGRNCEGGYTAAKKLFAMPESIRPTACFAAYDNLAYGIIRAARECGIRIPEDFSVIGVDNNEVSGFINPALTSVKMPVEEVGNRASEMLLDRINGSTAPFSTVFLAPELEVRESTGKKI